MDDIFGKFQKDELRKKYGYRLKKYIDFAMKNVFRSERQIEFEIYQAGTSRVSAITKNFEIEDHEKAYTMNGKIYVSDWAMEQKKEDLMHIVIHEICHVLNPEHSEDKVIKETDLRFKELSNYMMWKIF